MTDMPDPWRQYAAQDDAWRKLSEITRTARELDWTVVRASPRYLLVTKTLSSGAVHQISVAIIGGRIQVSHHESRDDTHASHTALAWLRKGVS